MRINVSLSEDSYQSLKETSQELGIDMSEFVRNAIRVYYSLKREQLDGKRVYIGNRGKIEKELLVP